MANKPKQKQDWGSIASEKFLVQEQQKKIEEQKAKSYQEILKLSEQNLENSRFIQAGTVSTYDTALPYYGEQMQPQYEAAAEYARQLQSTENPKVTIPESYYNQFTKQTPLVIGNTIPAYNATQDVLQMPNPALYKAYMTSVGQDPKAVLQNNYGENALSSSEISKNLMDYWRNTAEHEAGHIPDKQITFSQKPPVTISTHTGSAFDKPTYMAQENHLVTGLGKVQREQYALTGKRFENPEEFKSFLFKLAQSENPEKEISFFSEEAKRTLRPQIQNAIQVKNYQDALDIWKNKKGWFKGQEPLIQGNPDLLEKSAQLIPALVSNQEYNNHTS